MAYNNVERWRSHRQGREDSSAYQKHQSYTRLAKKQKVPLLSGRGTFCFKYVITGVWLTVSLKI